jgi:AcrR family transcriptional regulator
MIRRVHTGRRRNEAAREAILQAAADLLAAGSGDVAVSAIAKSAGVGKQTIYRWWPSKRAVLIEAMASRGQQLVSVSETGVFAADLKSFLTATFAAARQNRALLLGVLSEALTDPSTMSQFCAFAASRRQALQSLLDRACQRGEITKPSALIVDQIFGTLWYRLIFHHAPLNSAAASKLSHAIVDQLTPD